MPSEVKTTYYENGQKRMEGNYKDGEYNGKWNYWYENGQKYKDVDITSGTWNSWYESGQKMSEGQYDGDIPEYFLGWLGGSITDYPDYLKDGKWTYWYENGQKRKEGSYKVYFDHERRN